MPSWRLLIVEPALTASSKRGRGADVNQGARAGRVSCGVPWGAVWRLYRWLPWLGDGLGWLGSEIVERRA